MSRLALLHREGAAQDRSSHSSRTLPGTYPGVVPGTAELQLGIAMADPGTACPPSSAFRTFSGPQSAHHQQQPSPANHRRENPTPASVIRKRASSQPSPIAVSSAALVMRQYSPGSRGGSIALAPAHRPEECQAGARRSQEPVTMHQCKGSQL